MFTTADNISIDIIIDNHEIEFTSAEISQLKLTYLCAPIFPLLFLFLFFMDNLPEHALLIVFLKPKNSP